MGHGLVIVHLLAAGLTGTVAWRTIRHRHVPGARSFGWAMAAVSVWAVSSGLEETPIASDPVIFSLLVRLDWIPISVVAIAWLSFGLAYTGRDDQVTRPRIAALSIVPAVTVFVALCHPLLVPEYAALLGPLAPMVEVLRPIGETYDPVTAAGTAYVYLLVAAGSVLLLEVLVERPEPDRGQLLLLAVVAPPWVLNGLHLGGILTFETFDPTIVGFTVSGVAGLFAVGRFELFAVPLARAHVIDEIDSGILVFGRDGRVYDYNDRAAELLSLSPAALGTDVRGVLDESPLDVDLPVDVPLFADPEATGEPGSGDADGDAGPGEPVRRDGDAGRGGDSSPGAVVDGGVASLASRLDGATLSLEAEPGYVETRLSDLSGPTGEPVSRVLHLYDVTDRERRRRELERKNEFLDEFAGVVSHDVATPLNVIENKARLIEMTGDTAHAEEIFEATERVHRLVDELRTLAREGKQVGETRPVDLREVTREAWQSIEAPAASLTVGSTATIQADRDRLRQLLGNLLENAAEHGVADPQSGTADDVARDGEHRGTDHDGVERRDCDGAEPADAGVTIRVGASPEGFYVADDGPGLPFEEPDRVFEQGVTTVADGTGLGLAIVHRIVEGHGWTIEVTDSSDGGARFEVRTRERAES